ncbi:hypothetical protein [Brevibacterium otitidis]|uniref:Phage tail assembly chaperone protein, E, or 41 or 14 n=1 Tax=Brevibacterium otitidis TaxID=53364 RepID=A0ABV5X1M0_9MICO|nr:hypothetical protein GCM10023233_22640 [Brevibacterium otitidis]
MAEKKKVADSRPIDINLSSIELGAEARPYLFAFKGERFETIDIADLMPDDVMKAYRDMNRGDLWAMVRLLLPKNDFARFKDLSPTIWQLKAIGDAIGPVMQELFGSPEGFTE